jgi:oxaloacetate decarboxylase gamma subunit
MQGDIVHQGLELMLYGMGTVVVFLTLLIATVSLMSWFLSRFFPDAEVPVAGVRPGPTSLAVPADVPLAAVIAAAVHRHRSGRR